MLLETESLFFWEEERQFTYHVCVCVLIQKRVCAVVCSSEVLLWLHCSNKRTGRFISLPQLFPLLPFSSPVFIGHVFFRGLVSWTRPSGHGPINSALYVHFDGLLRTWWVQKLMKNHLVRNFSFFKEHHVHYYRFFCLYTPGWKEYPVLLLHAMEEFLITSSHNAKSPVFWSSRG